MEALIKSVIDEDINPYLAMHSGSCEFVAVDEENNLTLRLHGGCSGCPSSHLTLFNGIIPIIKEKIPEIQEIFLD